MTTPERRDDIERQRIADNLEEAEAADSPGRNWLVWSWVVLIVIGLGFFWFAGWGWGGYGGWWWGRAPLAQKITGSGVAVLAADNKAPYVGRPFTLRNVAVEREVTPQVFWVRGGNTRPMLLVLTNTGDVNATTITPGERISAAGVVEKAPSSSIAQEEWKLSGQDVQTLEEEQAYLQAPAVERTP